VMQAICTIQGTRWPTPGTTIDLQFRAPVKPGMTISSVLVVNEKTADSLICDMTIQDQDGKPCVKGTVNIK